MKPFKQATIVGAGAMGRGIAQVLAEAGVNVTLYDTHESALTSAIKQLDSVYSRLVEKGRRSRQSCDEALARITTIVNFKDAEGSDLVIEAIIESLDAKRSVFQMVDDVVSEDCVLATNTSSLSIAAISAGVNNPGRVVGLHFFNPAALMPLVEIVPSLATDPDVLARCKSAVKAWGKSGVVAADSPGFIVNRVARPFYAEAMHMLEEGLADVPTIDWAMREIGGFRMGPFQLMDLIGHDVNYVVTETVWTQFYFDPRFRPNLTQKRLLDAGWLGRKSGKGFYDYTDGASNPSATEDRALGQVIVDRITALLFNEAADALYRNICSASDLETAMLRGVNYPKGLLQWANETGLDIIVSRLNALRERTGDTRYRPCPLLVDMASNNQLFEC